MSALAVLANVLYLVLTAVALGIAWLVSCSIARVRHARMRTCANPLHRAEADQRAALWLTRRARNLIGFGVVLSTGMFVPPEPAWLYWSTALGAAVAMAVVTAVNAAWQDRRIRQLELSAGRCAA